MFAKYFNLRSLIARLSAQSAMLVVGGLCLVVVACPADASYGSDVQALVNYLGEIQLADGAFADSDSRAMHTIDPNLSMFADMGLAEVDDAAPVLANLQWYVANMLPPGTYGGVYYPGCPIPTWTFTTSPFAEATQPPPWNTDSTAGNFLTAMMLLYQTGDPTSQAWVATQEANAECVAASQLGTFQPTYNLTTNFPGYPAMEAMDNFDGWRGMGSAAWLEANVWNNATMSSTYATYQTNLGIGLSALWDTTTGLYDLRIRVHKGRHSPASCATIFFPDCLVQLWAVTDGYLSPTDPKAVTIWTTFKTDWPGAPDYPPPARDAYARSAWAAQAMGDTDYLSEYDTCLNHYEEEHGYPFPSWFSMDGGQMLTALALPPQYRREYSPRRDARSWGASAYRRGRARAHRAACM
jgi:hypothetical protein